MVKKKGIVSKLVLGLFILTALSFCFLGSTFARFTSGGNGSATADIAKWDVTFDINASENTPVNLGMISPSDDEYVAGKERVKEGEKVLVASITNKSDVAAEVTIDIGEIGFGDFNDFGAEWWSAAENNIGNQAPCREQVASLFKVEYFYGGNDNLEATAEEAKTSLDEKTAIKIGAGSADAPVVVNIYAQITWTSADKVLGFYSDELDTWVGKWVPSLTTTFTFTAVQASETPAANA